MHYWNGYGHMAWMGLWWIFGGVALAVVLWVTLASAGRPMNGRGDSPERIARKRYARGEIDHDAFQKIMHDLKG